MDKQIEKFSFYYLALAAKHWYVREKFESIYDFVLRLVRLENKYIVFDKRDHKAEAVRYCLMCLDELAEYYRSNGVTKWWDNYLTMNSEINKFLHLYDAKEREEALILFVFNILMMLDNKDIHLPAPVYGKGYPRMDNKNGMTYTEMRNRAKEVFGWAVNG